MFSSTLLPEDPPHCIKNLSPVSELPMSFPLSCHIFEIKGKMDLNSHGPRNTPQQCIEDRWLIWETTEPIEAKWRYDLHVAKLRTSEKYTHHYNPPPHRCCLRGTSVWQAMYMLAFESRSQERLQNMEIVRAGASEESQNIYYRICCGLQRICCRVDTQHTLLK